MGEIVLVFVLSILVALLYNAGQPRFAASAFGQRLHSNFAGQTLSTALVFALAILISSWLLRTVYESPLKS